jgi:hypothetical protein
MNEWKLSKEDNFLGILHLEKGTQLTCTNGRVFVRVVSTIVVMVTLPFAADTFLILTPHFRFWTLSVQWRCNVHVYFCNNILCKGHLFILFQKTVTLLILNKFVAVERLTLWQKRNLILQAEFNLQTWWYFKSHVFNKCLNSCELLKWVLFHIGYYVYK